MGVRHRIVNHVGRCAEALQGGPCEDAAQNRHYQSDHCAQEQRGAGDGFHQVRLARAPGLADEHASTCAEANDQGDEEEDDGEHARHGGQGLGAEHLADVDAVYGARHGLEEIGKDHGGEEKEVGFPEGMLRGWGLH